MIESCSDISISIADKCATLMLYAGRVSLLGAWARRVGGAVDLREICTCMFTCWNQYVTESVVTSDRRTSHGMQD